MDRATRSRIMGAIRSRDTGPERAIMGALRRQGVTGWRRYRRLFGISVDFSWPRERVALLVQGCFWHRCPKCFRLPKARRSWWRRKVLGNAERDRRQITTLREGGWHVVKVWECALHHMTPGEVACMIRAVVELRRRGA